MDVATYLERINYSGSPEPTLDTLRQLQIAHLQAVPFENLDIPLGRQIELTLESRYQKVVIEQRGGFCYELNGLFCWLLRELGFSVSMLAARVFNGTDFGPPLDHLLLLVELDGQEWVTDVGFGDSYREPLRLDETAQEQFAGTYQILPDYDGLTLYQSRDGEEAKPHYTFTRQTHQLSDYREMCHYQQTSPDSGFTRRQVCTIATPTGRMTISNGRLITTNLITKEKTEHPITTEPEYRHLLKTHFGIVFPTNMSLEILLAKQS
ncbi:MAG: arylamine N-acetyltransferase [Chloroflexota bacterium]